jgi:hypothetical protein
MRRRSSIVIALALLCAAAVPLAQTTRSGAPRGAATPQEAVATINKATAANDMLGALPVVSPAGLRSIASEGVTGVLMFLAFSDPDDTMPGAPKPSKTELDAQRKKYKDALAIATSTLKPYALDMMIGKPVLADETQKTIDAAIGKADTLALITSLYNAMMKMGPLLGMKDAKPRPLVEIGAVTGYKITGDKATAQNGAESMTFVRLDGRWFIEPPSSKGPGGESSPSATSAPSPQGQGRGRQGGAPRPSAAGKDPEVVAGGIQIAKVIVPDNDFSGKPFHTDNGTTLVLWVRMPAGQGLIELDDDASLLQSFGDDKGTNMGGKFGSFPQEFKDGSGGIIEIASSGFAAQGATALVAEGTLAMTVSTGTKKTRVANVRLQNDAKFNFGTTPITVSDVETEGESQNFTLKLPRQVMTSIKDVAFLDAKGAPIEGRRTSSGYMNDAAELGFSVKTAAKTLTLEFEAWQGLKTIKVPFKVRATLGLEK